MSKVDIDLAEVVERYGTHITGQINVSYYTEQTLGQFIEICEQDGLTDTYTEEDFYEYVISNVAEQIRNEVIFNGEKSLLREITLVGNSDV